MFVKLEQFRNTLFPIEVTLPGIVMLIRLEQLRNALLPNEVTLLGIVIPLRFEPVSYTHLTLPTNREV